MLTGEKGPFAHIASLSPPRRRISGTAIKADPDKQHPSIMPVTHYFDVERVCRDCGRPFIFFAKEQKHWYETLRFPLEADCVRCPECRRTNQKIARCRATYESLLSRADRTQKETERMLAAMLVLVEQGIFSSRKLEMARMHAKRLPEDIRTPWIARIIELEKTMVDTAGR